MPARKKTVATFRAKRHGTRTVQFQCPLKCQRCIYRYTPVEQATRLKKNPNAAPRCMRTVCVGVPYCYSHLQKAMHLKIAMSTIPHAGKGLFAWNPKAKNGIVFKKNDIIATYAGEIVNGAELARRYDYNVYEVTAPYAIGSRDPKRKYDAACKRVTASLANDPQGSRYRSNAKYTNFTPPNIKATQNIKHGREIMVSYGPGYWKGVNVCGRNRRGPCLDVSSNVRLIDRGRLYARA